MRVLISPDREAVRRIRPEEGARLSWEDVEHYVLPEEAERWAEIKPRESKPFDALRKLKFLL